VYPAVVAGKCAVLIEDLRGRHATRSLEGCYSVWDWSPDGSSLLTFETGKPTTIDVRNIVAGTRTLALSHPTQALFSARFSPDGKWIAFTSGLSSPQARVYIAPFNGRAPSESDWITVSDDPSGGEPAWSPDGRVLYFHSKRDGFHCIWAQKLSWGKKPEGEPIAIQHLHASSFGMYFLKAAEFGMAITKDQLILNLAKGEGDIWSTTIEKK
jgi:WD40 repeat protein